MQIDLEFIPGTVVLADADGVITHANRQCLEATGFQSNEMVGSPLTGFWEVVSEALPAILRHLEQEPVWRNMIRHKRKDGGYFNEIIAISKLPDDNETGFCLLKVGQPVAPSPLQNPEAIDVNVPPDDLIKMPADYRAIFDAVPYAIAVNRMSDQRYLFFNKSFCHYTGYSQEELCDKTHLELNLFHDITDWRQMRETVQTNGNLDGFEVTFRRRDFRLAHALISVRPVYFSGQFCMLYVSQDIEEVNTAQETLRQSVENYRTIIEGAPVSIAVTRLSDSVYQEVNDSFCRRVHFRREEILGRTPPDLNFYTNLEDRERFLQMFSEKGFVDDLEIRFQDKFGQTLESLVSARRLRYKGQECLLYISTRIDNLKAAQRALEESETRFRTIFETAADPIFLNDIETGRFLDVNHAACRHLGYNKSEFLALSFSQIHPPEDVAFMPRFSEDPDDKKGLFFESRHLRKDGSNAIVEVSSQQMTHQNRRVLLSIARDITERKQIEEELSRYRQSLEQMVAERTKELKAAQKELVKKEKMAVLGKITATVSHELRNPFGVIRTSNFFIHRQIKCSDDKIEKHFKRIDEQITLCDAIVGDLLEYTSGRHVVTFYQNIAAWLEKVVGVQREQAGLDLTLRIAPYLPKISYDQGKMQRVIVNLINNAVQAVNDRAEQSAKLGVDYSPSVDIEALPKDERLFIAIEDNGVGMAENTLAHAFEPLFTTRARGPGMGLAIVKKIVEEHGGSITLESRLGEGTKVLLSLPLVQALKDPVID